jgi:broad specificity phosphatase PhoE
MLNIDTYLVRHGHYDHNSDEIDERGAEESKYAAGELSTDYYIGQSALVLSSDAPRALGTARIIAAELDDAPVIPSLRMNLGGNEPEAIRDLDEWILKSLQEAGASLEDKSSLIVVTHEPLIRVAVYGSDRRSNWAISHGEVNVYRPGRWKNTSYHPAAAKQAERLIGRQ